MVQLTFDWSVQNKYNKLKNFEVEVRNIFMTKNMMYQMQNELDR